MNIICIFIISLNSIVHLPPVITHVLSPLLRLTVDSDAAGRPPPPRRGLPRPGLVPGRLAGRAVNGARSSQRAYPMGGFKDLTKVPFGYDI